MVNSYIEQPAGSGSNIHVEFGGDYSYSLTRSLFEFEEVGLATGSGQLVSGGFSVSKLKAVQGILASITKSTDKILWDDFDELLKSYTSTTEKARLRLYLDDQGGYLELDGWVTTYSAERSASTGLAVIQIVFDFLISSKNTANLN